MASGRVALPITAEEYETLLDRVITKFKLTDRHHAKALMAIAIKHTAVTDAYTTLDYLGHYILHNIAWYVADNVSKTMQHKAQVDQLESILKNEPNNAQAMDALQKAANEGSIDAKSALDRILPPPQQNVVAIK